MIGRLALSTLAVLGAMATTAATRDHPDARGLHYGSPGIQSLGAMTFGPDGTLFLADPRSAQIYAIDPGDQGKASLEKPVPELDRKVAALLGTTPDRIRFRDLAVHPTSHNLYLTVARDDPDGERPALIRVTSAASIELVDIAKLKFASTPLPEAPDRTGTTAWGQPQWTLGITDLQFVDGELYVAGLSNEQFASALRRIPFPFGKPAAISTVEIYHTSHDRWETAAPIEAFLPITIGGVPMILAGYGCSPIASFARADFSKEKHLKGKTLVELGGGSRPIDIIRYQKDGKDWVLIANNRRTLIRLDPNDLASAPALTQPVHQANQSAGVGYLPIASAGVMHIADYDDQYVAVLQRNIETGTVELTGFPKKWM